MHWTFVIFLGLVVEFGSSAKPEYSSGIDFVVFKKNHVSERYTSSACQPSDKVAIIIHGWRETCKAEWIPMLVKNLHKHRGGCVICMDYQRFSMVKNYFQLVRDFIGISEVLLAKLESLEASGFDPENFYMFGFSFGGRLALKAGMLFGEQIIEQIDTCDMAGPGFDNTPLAVHNPKLAAKNVQCIHTSTLGSSIYTCSQNWLMGNCGRSQPAAEPYPKGSHGLCPYFYNAAFDHPFYAEARPETCARQRKTETPKNYRMGYMQTNKWKHQGIFYATTLKDYPYAKKKKDLI